MVRAAKTVRRRVPGDAIKRAVEALESRCLLSAVPTLMISGPGSVSEASPYILSLAGTADPTDPIQYWTVNWGDGAVQQVEGNPSSVMHLYDDGLSTPAITATATTSAGTYAAGALAGATEPDATFGTAGLVSVSRPTRAMAIQPDGKIIVVGTGNGTFWVSRYNVNGSLDTTFGTAGVQLVDFGPSTDVGTAVAIASDGKIVVGGQVANPSTGMSDFGIARLNSNGTLDATFGTGGVATVDILNNDTLAAVAVQADGKIVAAGVSQSGFTLVRFGSNGMLDTTFDMDGKVTPAWSNSNAFAVAIDSSGRILATGSATGKIVLARYNSDGSPDLSFGTAGSVLSSSAGTGRAIALQADGKIVVGGNISTSPTPDAGIIRYLPTGELDTTFGSGGVAAWGAADTVDIINSIALDSAGSIVAGLRTGTSQNPMSAVLRFTPEGQLDSSFGVNGAYQRDFSPSAEQLYGVGLQASGRIVVAVSPAGASLTAILGLTPGNASALPIRVDNVVPVAFATGQISYPAAGIPITLAASATDVSAADAAAGFTFSWQVTKNGQPYASGSGASFTFTPDTIATYVASVTAADKNGGVSQPATLTFTVGNAAPVAVDDSYGILEGNALDTSPNPTHGDMGVLANDHDADGDPLTATLVSSTSHGDLFFNANGTFTYYPDLGFTGTDSFTYLARDSRYFASNTATVLIQVAANPVHAEANGPYTTIEGTPITLSSEGSKGTWLQYQWDLSDSAGVHVYSFTEANPALPAWLLSRPDTYTLALRVTDYMGRSSSDSATLTVGDIAPTVSIAGASSVGEGQSYTLSLLAQGAAGDTIRYWTIDWGDGNVQRIEGNPSSATWSYPDGAQSRTITATVTDWDGTYASNSLSVNVLNVAPVANVTWTHSVLEGGNSPWDSSSKGINIQVGDVYDPSWPDTYAGFCFSYDFSNDGVFEIADSTLTSVLVPASYYDDGPAALMMRARVSDRDGGYTDYLMPVTIVNAAPEVSFGGTSMGASEGSPVQFEMVNARDRSIADTNAGFRYSFDLNNDGVFDIVDSTEAVASYTFSDSGTYRVRGRITDKDGAFGETFIDVYVANVAPVASITGWVGAVAIEGRPVPLIVTGTDVSPADIAAGLSYSWSVSRDGNAYASGNGAAINFTPDDSGVYLVTATAMDQDGGVSDPVTAAVSVRNQAPMAVFADSGPVGEGSLALFSFSSQSDAPGDVAAGFTYAYDFDDDGEFEVSGSPLSSVEYTFADDGSYTVRGRIYDKDGGFSEYSTTVTVEGGGPTAIIVAPSEIRRGHKTTFTLLASDPSTVDAMGIFTWYIDWEGDGRFEKTLTGVSGITTRHRFHKGEYTIRAYAVDEDGAVGDVTELLIVVQ